MGSAATRRRLGLIFATVAGIALAVVDSRPGFDAVGITVVGLIGTAALAVVISATRAIAAAVLLGLVSGMWVPILELDTSAGFASFAAIGFAIAGALGGTLVVRLLQGGGITVR